MYIYIYIYIYIWCLPRAAVDLFNGFDRPPYPIVNERSAFKPLAVLGSQ